jgi:3-carboxy-cis,cis-muconate cycloisomerase
MSVSPFDSKILGELFSDQKSRSLFDDEAEIKAMMQVESALARSQAKFGIIPESAAQMITEVLADTVIEPEQLSAGTASAGVPVPEFVRRLRSAVGDEAGQYLHWGATSQDIIDTGLILRLRDYLDLIEDRIENLKTALREMVRKHRSTVMVARTRSQQATPTTLGLKVAGWLAPFNQHSRRLSELRHRLLVVQFGGSSGNLSVLGGDGIEVMDQLSKELGLRAPVAPWHNQRENIAELAGFLSLITGSLGKLGEDLILLGLSEVSEVRATKGGGSSTMPQKANPIQAEALVTLARFNAGLVSTMHNCILHPHERDGPSWSLEWLALPQMAVATGTALVHANSIVSSLHVDTVRIEKNLADSSGLILAEAASFALSEFMSRAEALAMVKSACSQVLRSGDHLMTVLADMTDVPIDWDKLRDPSNHVGVSDRLIDRILNDTG